MTKYYLITISEELYNKLPKYVITSIYWAYRYNYETKTVSYATVCSKETYDILKTILDEIVEKEKL